MAARAALAAACAATAAAGSIRPSSALPMVIGHRGLLSKYPENTMISFQAALAAGADGIEGDLHLTQDGIIVMMHDDTLDRTTNCTGMVENHTLAQLASCNAANLWPQYGFQPIPLFEDVIALISQPQYMSFLVMDIKEHLVIGSKIQPILAKYGAESRAIASCWTPAQMQDAVVNLPNGPRQMLTSSTWGDPLSNSSLWSYWMDTYGLRGFSLYSTPPTYNQSFVSQAHARLLSVVAWTVDDMPTARMLASWGVDGIITDVADVMVAMFNQLQAAVNGAICGDTGCNSTNTTGAWASATPM